MNRSALLLAAAFIAAPTAILPARAWAQATPERAQAIESQLKDWLQQTVGPAIPVERSPVTVTAAGDHFDLAYRLDGVDGKPSLTAKLTEVEGGRWAINDVTWPSPATLHLSLPPQKPSDPPAETTVTLAAGRQSQQALIDPSLATPSTTTGTAADIDATAKLPSSTQIIHVDSTTSHGTLTPASNGRVNTAGDAVLNGYSVKTSMPGQAQPMTFAASSITVASSMTGLSLERVRDIIQLAAQSAHTRQAQKAAGQAPPPLDRTTQLALLAALSDLMTGFSTDQQMTNVTIAAQGLTGSLDRLAIFFDAKSIDGKLQLRLPISLDGLHLPDLGGLARLIPTRLSITPRLSALPADVPFLLARDRIDDPQAAPNLAALFRDGPVGLGIDDFRLDLAGASFAGHIGFLVASPASVTGTGQLIADNLDSLQQAIAATPSAAQVAPLILFLKGLARTEGTHAIWDIDYRDGHLLINNQDMQALMNAVAPRPDASRPNAPPRRPNPARP